MDRTESPELLDDASLVAQRIVDAPLHLNSGAMLMRHLVWRVADRVGDGTATAAVIAQALLRETTRHMAAGANPAVMRKGIESGLLQALASLDGLVMPVQDMDHLRHVALAAGHDDELASTITGIYEQRGLDIVISLQEWQANTLSVEVADGSKWDSGYASQAFINDPDRGLAWSEDPYLLFTNDFLETAEQIIPVMEKVAAAGGTELVVIAASISDAALAPMLATNERGGLHSLAILAPGLGDHRVGVLHDLAALTGGNAISSHSGDRIEDARIEDLGRCGIVWASRDFFSVIDGEPDETRVAERVRLVTGAIEREETPSERDLLRQRLGRLTGGVAVLGVGAATKTEITERMARAGRMVRAIEAARRDGVAPGGGVGLVAAAQAVETCNSRLTLDERFGRLALVRALEEPLSVIVENAGGEPGPILHAARQGKGHVAYDARTGETVDPFTVGILDPINVLRLAVQAGVSTGVMAMLTEVIVIPKYRLLHAPKNP
jgi:chaperonin GroEL